MNSKKLPFLFLFCFSLLSFFTYAQNGVSGTINDPLTNRPIGAAEVGIQGTDLLTLTNDKGYFELVNVPVGNQTIVVNLDGYNSTTIKVEVKENQITKAGKIELNQVSTLVNDPGEIPIISISTDDVGDIDDQNISGLLSANRDAFIETTQFTWGSRRFRVRGYDSRNFMTYVNGVLQNDPENGRVSWSNWGGLNDVTRNQDITMGLNPMDYSFGGIGGGVNLDLRANSQRVQRKISYARANTSYSNRIMATYSTGMRANGWGFTASGSRRWAQEGYVEGTTYDAWAYLVSIDRKIDNHLLNLTVLGSPNKRGKQGGSVQEMNDLAKDNFYNPNWGFQNGEKRNARVGNFHQPMAILSHQWEINDKTSLNTGVSFQEGRAGGTALDWYDAPDPRPDYYRRLPSFIDDPAVADRVSAELSGNQAARQINWDNMFFANRNNMVTLNDVSNVDGGTVSGLRSNYIVEDRRYDSRRINFNSTINSTINDQLTIMGGIGYQHYKGDNYKKVVDLLGGDFYLDIDKFAERDLPGNSDAIQNDVDNPNRIVKEGDRFGWGYEPNIRKGNAWVQGKYSLQKVDFYGSAEFSNTRFWRNGLLRNGKFPENSFGKSEVQNFNNYGVKGGATIKLDGRNYIDINSSYRTMAPFFRQAYVSPRTRDEIAPNLKSTRIFSSDATYFFKSPKYKARLGGYFTTFKDQNKVISFYHDQERAFVNYLVSGIDQQHFGLEAALDFKITPALSAQLVASLGQYIYTSRPKVTISQDNTAQLLQKDQTVYGKNFYVPGTAQKAVNAGLTYRGAKYYNIYLDVSYLGDNWIDFNPTRRTTTAVEGLEENLETFENIINQEKSDGGFMVDISVTKSFKWDNYYLSFNLNVNNVLNNTTLRTGGYEQLRFDFEGQDVDRFPNRYFYAYGTNFFAGINFSF